MKAITYEVMVSVRSFGTVGRTMPTLQPTFGDLLREWRGSRRVSQLDLAAEADVSQRHLSFLETGRSEPSREMVIHIASVLDVPLRDRNRLLVAAGYAPAYPQRGLDEPELEQVRHVLELILGAHEPFPAYVIDRAWNLVLTNRAAGSLVPRLIDPADAALFGGNLVRLTFHPRGLRGSIVNWEEAALSLLDRLEREAAERPGDETLTDLLAEVRGYPGVTDLPERPRLPSGADLLVPLHLRTADLEVRLFTTIATIGAPYDVTLEELRLETLFPADEESEEALRAIAGVASR